MRPFVPLASISLVVPCRNAGRAIEEFTRSLLAQSVGPAGLQIIFVDHGSTDDTRFRIIDAIAALPRGAATLLDSPDGGAASARNAGMAAATGEWISFPDPGDRFDPRYFETVRRQIARHGRHLSMLAARPVQLHNRHGEASDAHWSRDSFRGRLTLCRANDPGMAMQKSVRSAFFRRDLLVGAGLAFDGRAGPAFEEAHLATRYLAYCPDDARALFVAGARYICRQRGDEEVATDPGAATASWLEAPEFGWLGLLRDVEAVRGRIPVFVQRTVLHDLATRVSRLLASDAAGRGLDDKAQERCLALLGQVMDRIDPDVLELPLPGLTEGLRVALAHVLKPGLRREGIGYVVDWEPSESLVRVLIALPGPLDDVMVLVDGAPAEKRDARRARIHRLGRTWRHDHVFWIRLGNSLCIEQDGRPWRLSMGGREWGSAISRHEVKSVLARNTAGPDGGQLWLFADRSYKADDNAEHLYRYLMKNPVPAVRTAFILRADSPDWNRLRAEGFDLIAIGSQRHRRAVAEATLIASSHHEPSTLRTSAGENRPYRYAFLRHGVANQDMSRWLNQIAPSLVVASSPREASSFLAEDGMYNLTRRQVALTGLPRYDALLAGAPKSGSTIFIMPTWRQYLARHVNGRWTHGEDFEASSYVRHWRDLLNSEALAETARRHGLTVTFCPHPIFAGGADAFAAPRGVRVVDIVKGPPIQPLIQEAALVVTDYSSIAFDAAYIGRPVAYFHFDRAEIFGGKHTWAEGYFDYERDGFGPVATTAEEVARAGEQMLAAPPDIYRQPRESFFEHIDTNNCERVTRALLDLTGTTAR